MVLGSILGYELVTHFLACLLIVNLLHLFFLLFTNVKINRIYHVTGEINILLGIGIEYGIKKWVFFCLWQSWFSSDSKGREPPSESQKPLPVAVWFILGGIRPRIALPWPWLALQSQGIHSLRWFGLRLWEHCVLNYKCCISKQSLATWKWTYIICKPTNHYSTWIPLLLP